MAVPCPRCGREYDVALFAFGRTIWCTCGERVGVEARVRDLARLPPRFAADAMLGRLARWLRLLGFDCSYDPDASDEALVRLAVAEARTLLTRDRRLPEEWWIEGVHVVREEDPRRQLAEVLRHFELAPWIRIFTRCSECNEVLVPAAPTDVASRVPGRILALHAAFAECPRCGRVYWEGSHTERIRAVVADLLGDVP